MFKGRKSSQSGSADDATLELSAFIRDTLVQIVQGVEQARAEVAKIDSNAEICPTGLHWPRGSAPSKVYKVGRGFVQDVEFDVALTVVGRHTGEGAGKAELGIAVPMLPWLGKAAVEGGAKLTREQEKSEISRVTFTIPLLLPSELYDWDELKPNKAGAIEGKNDSSSVASEDRA